MHKVVTIGTPNMSSAATRSRGISESSLKKNTLLSAQNSEYFSPPSPVNLRRIEPIRRISRNKVNISQTS